MDRTSTNASHRKTTMIVRAHRRVATLLAFALAACGQPATPPDGGKPKVARAAADGQVCAGGGAHAKHVQDLTLACEVCHPSGAEYGFADAWAVTYPRGTTTRGGIITVGDPTATPPTQTTCAVGCHSPMGAPAHTIAWAAPGPLACTACHDTATFPPSHPTVASSVTRAECQGCHVATGHGGGTVALVGHDQGTWLTDRTSPTFHAYAAERGLSQCQKCHRQDLSGGATGFSCAQCHDTKDASGAVVSWKTNCTMCHGGTDDQTGAPPKAIWGQASDPVRTGAHGAHAVPTAISPGFACDACHVNPADVFAANHIDELAANAVPIATVTFGGLAVQGGLSPSWTRASATCASTYCHGSFKNGNATYTPDWTAPATNACGTCHDLPPGGTHPKLADASRGLQACSGCHPDTMTAAGTIIPAASGGKHLDGIVEAQGHPASWMDPGSSGFHAYSANLGLAACTSCHGTTLAGGTGRACAACHDGVQANLWNSCTMCHGGTDDQTGAPPRTTWGQSADPIRTGAHARHLASAMPCGACHVVPADAFTAGHVDQATATVTFAGLALTGIAPAAPQPAWSRASASCASTYCHGNFKNGNAAYAPSWTAPAANACGTCHGLPPGGTHLQNPNCGNCHDGYTASSVNPLLHLNGAVDVLGMTCTSCHGDSTRAATAQNPQLAAAPPLDTRGNSDPSAAGVGAHQAHLTDGALRGALACTECHTVPTSTANHPTGALDLTWGPLATTGGVTPTFAGTTCASTYCHGATLQGGTNTAPSWTGGASQAACGTCHGAPPPSHQPMALTACVGCHPQTVDATGAIIPTSQGGKHIDGALQVSGGHGAAWMDQTSTGFHAYSANASLASCTQCHGADLSGAAARGCASCHDGAQANLWGSCTMCHGGTDNGTGAPPRAIWGDTDPVAIGAHKAHVTGVGLDGKVAKQLSQPFDCVACHVKPADALAAGHVDGTVTVTGWTGTGALLGLATDPGFSAPTASTASCATSYCHGATIPGGTDKTPLWTKVDGTQAACGTCHGMAPDDGPAVNASYKAHRYHVSYRSMACQNCHLGYAWGGTGNSGNAVDPAKHVNGVNDVNGLDYCNTPQTTIVGWDCAGCHATRYVCP